MTTACVILTITSVSALAMIIAQRREIKRLEMENVVSKILAGIVIRLRNGNASEENNE